MTSPSLFEISIHHRRAELLIDNEASKMEVYFSKRRCIQLSSQLFCFSSFCLSIYFLMGNRQPQSIPSNLNNINIEQMSRAIVGGGCFWCVEAILQRLKGVQKVESGYAGGLIKNPTYQSVCSGQTGHAEVCRVYYDPSIIDYRTLLYIFLHIHDPTTLNRQGNDSGTQYRSIILYEKGNKEQYEQAVKTIQEVAAEGKYPGYPAKIVTEVKEMDQFYPAEHYHQNYYNLNTTQGYCRAVIKPKLSKFTTLFQKYIDSSRL